MDHIIQFLLIGLIFTIISKVKSEIDIKQYVKRYSKDGGMNIINSKQHYLKVSNEILHESVSFLVYKGTFDDYPVAIKITAAEKLFYNEMKAYEALKGENALSYGIPEVYYHGKVFGGECKAIVLSLFKETVEQRYKPNPRIASITRRFSDFDVLFIFKQAVKTLKYLHLKRVWHNNIMPENLLLLETHVFIANFHLATLNETQRGDLIYQYDSSNRFAKHHSCAMDDLESLIFSMWHVAGFDFSKPYGSLLLNEKKKNTAESWVKEICQRFQLKITQDVFTDICIKEMLSGEKVPKYDRILQLLSDAIDDVTQTTKQKQFEWL